ncbi:MAG: deoxyribose-phosphate aldolase [Candidatus Cloacimonadaceae bacterium]|jgi:deoxyribose-phosphate aldolase|nr:deoxyribose-phosphate aldolase [Candidatus Cloacimonadota bacterium]MDY0127093.1 deoxyribose-phosphate aldolase [Candidatus Cloacimonadaceae bacterium]MCB5255702.1 deoxyribose-phosphate aldolase [Candidatus Cloacimonadota bacterium]MCK9177776.1 deoxyribose-phosphate aldolase [Candidatus Cloacimonadota bacterium]MCK9241750.1 deoxyribose-phosphate aldolase [Candidatus Cloacimonadota bacterium]
MKSIEQIAREFFPTEDLAHCGGAHKICLHCSKCRADEPDELFDPEKGIAATIDATILKAEANADAVSELCEMANSYQTASVCINSYFIPQVKKLLQAPVKSCTVINFPLGSASRLAVKKEAKAVLEAGVDEVDMVQNLAALKSKDWPMVLETIKAVAIQCLERKKLLKVILETCYLDREELIISCLMSKKAGAKYVKTSTGFGSFGAKAEDVALMREVVGPKFGVKASGGIRTPEAARAMLEAGASRIGASSVKALL